MVSKWLCVEGKCRHPSMVTIIQQTETVYGLDMYVQASGEYLVGTQGGYCTRLINYTAGTTTETRRETLCNATGPYLRVFAGGGKNIGKGKVEVQLVEGAGVNT